MNAGRSTVLTRVLAVLCALGWIVSAGLALALWWSAQQLSAEIAREDSLGDALTAEQQYRLAWQTQLEYLGSREPTGEAWVGVYRARIVGVTKTDDVTFDWLDKPPGERPAVNRHLRTETLRMQAPITVVYIQSPTSNPPRDVETPSPIDVRTFLTQLRSNDSSAHAFLASEWWVTVYGSVCYQLVEAPSSPSR